MNKLSVMIDLNETQINALMNALEHEITALESEVVNKGSVTSTNAIFFLIRLQNKLAKAKTS